MAKEPEWKERVESQQGALLVLGSSKSIATGRKKGLSALVFAVTESAWLEGEKYPAKQGSDKTSENSPRGYASCEICIYHAYEEAPSFSGCQIQHQNVRCAEEATTPDSGENTTGYKDSERLSCRCEKEPSREESA